MPTVRASATTEQLIAAQSTTDIQSSFYAQPPSVRASVVRPSVGRARSNPGGCSCCHSPIILFLLHSPDSEVDIQKVMLQNILYIS